GGPPRRPNSVSLQDLFAKLRENLRHLAEKVIAVRAREFVHARTVPALRAVRVDPSRVDCGVLRQRLDPRSKIRIEEQWKRQPLVSAGVAYAVWRRLEPASGQPVEHVADVAD